MMVINARIIELIIGYSSPQKVVLICTDLAYIANTFKTQN